jgi:hypothetical protein
MAAAVTPVPPPTGRPAGRWGPWQSPSAAGSVNAVMAVLVALGAGWITVSLLVRGYAHGWYYVAGVLIVVSCVAQLAGEVALSCSASWLVRARLAAVVGATGVASAALLFADGHRIRSTCEGYCSQDMATGRRIEVVAVGVAVYAVLTTIRLLRPDRRSPALDAAVGVLAVALPVSYLVVAFFLGLH